MDMPKTTLQDFKAEVERLLVERSLGAAWAKELIVLEGPYIERVFNENGTPSEVAKEIHITKDEAEAIEAKADVREPHEAGAVIELKVSSQVGQYLQQLISLGLWGSSTQEVTGALINRQLSDLLACGLITRPANETGNTRSNHGKYPTSCRA